MSAFLGRPPFPVRTFCRGFSSACGGASTAVLIGRSAPRKHVYIYVCNCQTPFLCAIVPRSEVREFTNGRRRLRVSFPTAGTAYDPDLGGPIRFSIKEVSDDPDQQVSETIELMRQYAYEDSQSPIIQQESWTMRSGDPIDDVWGWISRKDGMRQMRFVHDEVTGRPWGDIGSWRPVVEALIRPVDQAVAPKAKGDCDDFSMYGAAHLLARGIRCSYCTVAADVHDPSVYSHVYLVAYPNSGKYRDAGRVPLDLSHGWFPGWETENKYGKRREWPVDANPIVDFDFCKAGFFIGAVSLGMLVWDKIRRTR